MIIKSIIKKILFKIGINIEKITNLNDIEIFISRFRDNYKSVELVRIGGDSDGGYLVPNILNDIKYCFSAGVGPVSAFEKHLSADYKIQSFMADASVSYPPEQDYNFIFIKKFLSSRTTGEFITLKDWIKTSFKDNTANIILQMDIEGSEFEVLTYESSEILAKFSSMIIEFHGLQNMSNKNFLKMITGIFEKIYSNFSICHVHPNNLSGVYILNGVQIPSNIEVTFIRNDLINGLILNSKVSLPHSLDKKNFNKAPEIKMPEVWWKK
jgi:hypothetical protein